MSLKPLQHDSRYSELDQVLRAYLGQPADDTSQHRSAALDAYLRHTWHTRPWALALAETQLREYALNPPGRLRLRLGEFYPVPDVGLAESEIQDWLLILADHLRHSVENGDAPPPAAPATHWEWHARFPELAQLLGGWFSQDMPDEFDDHDAALRDYLDTTDASVVARTVGELRELLALRLDDLDDDVTTDAAATDGDSTSGADYALALVELGAEVDPPAPYSPGAWLALIADRLT